MVSALKMKEGPTEEQINKVTEILGNRTKAVEFLNTAYNLKKQFIAGEIKGADYKQQMKDAVEKMTGSTGSSYDLAYWLLPGPDFASRTFASWVAPKGATAKLLNDALDYIVKQWEPKGATRSEEQAKGF